MIPAGAAARNSMLEGAAAAGAGALLFAAAAAIERSARTLPLASALVEEGGKAALILAAALVCRRTGRRPADAAAPARSPNAAISPRERRLARIGAARGLSLGLVAAAVFAAVENLAYFAAFPEAGILSRLVWSLPVHLDAALLEAFAALPLLGIGALARPAAPGPRPDRAELLRRRREGESAGALRDAIRRSARAIASPLVAVLAWLAGLAAGTGLHAAANAFAAEGPEPAALALGAAVGIAAFAALVAAFLDIAYIGGFLHGTD